MVSPVNGANNGKAPDGYNKVTMYDEKYKKTKTYFVPVGQNLTVNGKSYDLDAVKGNEVVFKGTNRKDSNFYLMGLSLEHMDVNKDGKINAKDTDTDMAPKINKKLNKTGSDLYVKDLDVYSNAGIVKGEGGVVFNKDVGDIRFALDIEKKNK